MSGRRVAPYGTWQSPFPIDLLVTGRVGLTDPRFDADDASLAWLEVRAQDGGRSTLVRWTEREGARDASPPGMNVRDRVHEYGGAPALVAGDLVIVSDFSTGLLHRVAPDRSSEPITPDGAFRYADLQLDEARGRLLAVREDHSGPGEPASSIVAIALDGSRQVSVLASGRSFYSSPRLSPGGGRLAFLAWDHPNLPWDGTELFVATVGPAGDLGRPELAAGSTSDWIAQPRWSPEGILHFVAEPTGWMNLHRWVDGRIEAVTDLEAELAYPDWVFGLRNYAFASDGTILAIGRSRGADRLYRIAPGRDPESLDLPFTELGHLDVRGDRAILTAAGPATFSAIVLVNLHDGSTTTVRRSVPTDLDPASISIPEPIEFPTAGGHTAHALFYRPTNPDFEAPPGERPPLVVTSHGGPTSQANSGLSIATQLFTSRGIAVVDVDYGGSTGYGRDYRKRLEGAWGVVDVDDCCNVARWLGERGDVDPERVAIRGGSASGFTTLASLAFRDRFKAGVSYFGLGDLEKFVHDTHKFESRYLERLVGPWPEAKARYHERSPALHAGGISCPVLVLQGLDDRVVPPAEAERIVDALFERGVPHAYIAYEGEDHGFRKAENIVGSFAAELSFYGQVFGFEPSDPIEPVTLVRPGR
jgi:dipeptidyl aminopeptidase/acylaminoacyl peptidase